MSVELLGGVLVAIGVVTVFAVFTRSLRAQGEAKMLKKQLAHLPRGKRRSLGRAVVLGHIVASHHQGEALGRV